MSESPYNLVDDEELLGEFKLHLTLTVDALKKAVQRGEKTFFLNILEELENLSTAVQAFEDGELKLELEGDIIPLEEIIPDEIPPTPDTTCCPSCTSTDLKDVIVEPFQKVAHKCLHCQAIFEPNYFVGNLEVVDLE